MSDDNFPVVIPKNLPVTRKIKEHNIRQHYVHTDVKLDNISYRHCEFDNVVFVYNGGPMEFSDNTVRGFTIRSDNKEINSMMWLLQKFGVIKGGDNE